jgi:hypothetical protein
VVVATQSFRPEGRGAGSGGKAEASSPVVGGPLLRDAYFLAEAGGFCLAVQDAYFLAEAGGFCLAVQDAYFLAEAGGFCLAVQAFAAGPKPDVECLAVQDVRSLAEAGG